MTSHQDNIDLEKPLMGKVAIVTGAGRPRGMGWATAKKLAHHGASVVVTDVARERKDLEMDGKLKIGDDFGALEKLVSQIEAMGAKGYAMGVDITNRKEIDACVGKSCEVFGGVDILFNNAGVGVGCGPFLEMTDQQWDLSYQVNLKGMADFCQEAIPVMIERGGGSIINNSSMSGLGVIEQMAGYSATKFGVIGLSKTLAAEFGRNNIRCNAICPGMVRTDMAEAEIKLHMEQTGGSYEDVEKEFVSLSPLGRWCRPEEIADAVAYLAGPFSSYITGVALPVAGGMSAGL